MSNEMAALIVVGIKVLLGVAVGSVVYLYFFRLWFRLHVAQCTLPLSMIFGLFFRRVSPQIIVNSYIDLHKAGLNVSVEELESHYQSGGNVRLVARALVSAAKNGAEVNFELARSLDLQGKDVMKEIGSGGALAPAVSD